MQNNQKKNGGSKRNGLLTIGIIASLGLTLLAFEWKTGELALEDIMLYEELSDEMALEDQPIEVKRKYNPPKPKQREKKRDIKVVDTLEKIVEYVTDTAPNPIVYNPNLPVDTIGSEPVVFEIDTSIRTFVDHSAEFPGGQKALIQYIKKHIRYPEECLEIGIRESIHVQFVVELDGSVTQVKAVRGRHRLLIRESERVVRSLPNWKPAELNGEKVRSYFKLPIRFGASR